ncbi:SDR family oxidoreductase [Natronorarus salvus]|uniref:SDR family oxidoreductase n=1 Tax=Natronorarus salvus TaxID=3117733 RepID=UPI002F26BC3F
MVSDRAEVGAGVENVDLSGRTVLVTGATGGIGRETALALGRLGARVLIHGRSEVRGREVLSELSPLGADPALFLADFASQEAVHALAAEVEDRVDRLDVLVNNAGGLFTDGELTEDGIEYTFAVNHLAPFVLTAGLYPLLCESEGRVVVVSSEAHRGVRLDFDSLRSVEGYSGWRAYAQSKLANVLFARELAVRGDEDGVSANGLHPGMVPGSGFGRDLPAPIRAGMDALSGPLAALPGPFVDSVVEGAETSVYLAASPEVEGVSGRYFVDCEERRPSRAARGERSRERLWTVSEELTDTTFAG